MTAEQLIEAMMRGIVKAVLEVKQTPKTVTRKPSVQRETLHVEMPPQPPVQQSMFEPPTPIANDAEWREVMDNIEAQLRGEEVPKDKYRPEEGVAPWMSS